MKKFTLIVLIAVFCIAFLFGCNPSTQINILNGDFESADASTNKPTGWEIVQSPDSEASITFTLTSEENLVGSDQYKPELGNQQLKVQIQSHDAYAYVFQNITVKTGQLYKLEGWMHVSSSASSDKTKYIGARIGFKEDSNFLSIHSTSATSWQKYTVYFKSNELKTLTLVAGIGEEGLESRGVTAYFDNISVTEVDESTLTSEELTSIVNIRDSSMLGNSTNSSNLNVALIFLVVLAILSICYILVKYTMKFKNEIIVNEMNVSSVKKILLSDSMLVCYLLIAAFIIRLVTSLLYVGNSEGINLLVQVASGSASGSPFNYYYSGEYLETGTIVSPLYLYVLWALGGIAQASGIEYGSIGFTMLIKLPAIIFDLATVALIFVIASRYRNKFTAFAFASIYAFLPTFIFTSTVWGTMESITAFFIALTLICILDKKYLGVVTSSLLGMLFDARFILVIPVVLFYLVYVMVKNKNQRILIPIYLVISLIVFYLAVLPYSYQAIVDEKKYFYIYTIYENLINLNKVFVNDAFNVYAMFAQNNVEFSVFANVLTYIIVCVILLLIAFVFLKSKNRLNLLLLTSFMYIFTAVFGVRMTPEFVLLGLLPLYIYVIITGNKKLFGVFAGYAALNYLNIAELLNISGYMSNNVNTDLVSFPRLNAVLITFSVFTVLLTAYMVFVVYEAATDKKYTKIQPQRESFIQYCYSFAIGFTELFKIKNEKLVKAKEDALKKEKSRKIERKNKNLSVDKPKKAETAIKSENSDKQIDKKGKAESLSDGGAENISENGDNKTASDNSADNTENNNISNEQQTVDANLKNDTQNINTVSQQEEKDKIKDTPKEEKTVSDINADNDKNNSENEKVNKQNINSENKENEEFNTKIINSEKTDNVNTSDINRNTDTEIEQEKQTVSQNENSDEERGQKSEMSEEKKTD